MKLKTIITLSAVILFQFVVKGQHSENTYRLALAEAYYRLQQIPQSRHQLLSVSVNERGAAWQVLNALTDRSIETINAANGSSGAVAISGSGTLIAFGYVNGVLVLKNVLTNSVQSLKGHTGGITSLQFSKDEKELISGSRDKKIIRWDTETGAQLFVSTTEFSRGIYSVDYSPDGEYFAASSWELSEGNKLPVVGFFKVFSRSDNLTVVKVVTDAHPASSIRFSAEKGVIYSGTWGFHIKKHSLPEGKLIWDFDISNTGYYTAIQQIDIAPDGNLLLSCGKDSRIRLIETQSGTLLKEVLPEKGHTNIINTVRFSSDGKRFVTGCDDGIIKVFATENTEVLATYYGHTGAVLNAAWSSDNNSIYTSSADGSIKKWSLTNPGYRSISVGSPGPWDFSLSFDGKGLATAKTDSSFAVYHINGVRITEPGKHHSIATSFSSDGRVLVCGGYDSLYFYEYPAGKIISVQVGYENRVSSIVHSGIAGLFAATGGKSVVFYNDAGKKEAETNMPNTGYALHFIPGKKEIVVGCTNGSLYFISTTTFKIYDSVNVLGAVYRIGISGDNKMITAGDKVYIVYPEKKTVTELPGHTATAFGVAVHPFEPVAVTTSYDRTLRYWDLITGECMLTQYGFLNSLFAVAFSKDGRNLLVGETQGVVHIFDLKSTF